MQVIMLILLDRSCTLAECKTCIYCTYNRHLLKIMETGKCCHEQILFILIALLDDSSVYIFYFKGYLLCMFLCVACFNSESLPWVYLWISVCKYKTFLQLYVNMNVKDGLITLYRYMLLLVQNLCSIICNELSFHYSNYFITNVFI